jgi:replication fork protection complex subunit Tof1/Swi1
MSAIEESGDDEPQSRTAQIRRALLPPIQSICSALGGYEDELAEDGSLSRVYKVGDECLSASARVLLLAAHC